MFLPTYYWSSANISCLKLAYFSGVFKCHGQPIFAQNQNVKSSRIYTTVTPNYVLLLLLLLLLLRQQLVDVFKMNHLRPCFKFQPKFIPSPSNNNNNSFNNNNWKLRRTFFAVARSCKVDDKGLAATIEDSKHTQLIFF